MFMTPCICSTVTLMLYFALINHRVLAHAAKNLSFVRPLLRMLTTAALFQLQLLAQWLLSV